MKIRDLMTRDVATVNPWTTTASACDALWRRDCGILPVVDDEGRLRGIVTDRDLCIALGTRDRLASQLPVGEVMTPSPRTCQESDDARTALETMRHAKVHRLPVIDAGGRVVGIVSMNDLVRCAASVGSRNGAVPEEDVVAALKSVCEKFRA